MCIRDRGDLAHQDVACVDLGAHADDTPLVQILQGVLAHVGDIPGDLLGPQLLSLIHIFPCIRVTDVRKAQSLAARWFYDNPSDSLTLIGVTGTKGKPPPPI